MNEDLDADAATVLVESFVALERLREEPEDRVFRVMLDEFIICLRQFYSIFELHKFRERYQFGSSADIYVMDLIRRFEILGKKVKGNDVIKAYRRHSDRKAKERKRTGNNFFVPNTSYT